MIRKNKYKTADDPEMTFGVVLRKHMRMHGIEVKHLSDMTSISIPSIYRHFGADYPKEVEREYNRCLRYEKYLQERDLEHGLVSYDTKKIPEITDRTTTQEYQRETEYEELWECRKAILPSALEWLKQNRPYEYGLIQEYFLSDTREKITLNVLARKYGVSAMSIKRSLKKGQRLLRTYIIQRETHG
ncbi:MAG: hypothetical protein E7493_02000 [Ruminococcus albus]|nr:hypothetical protein [Ruminococcus albus]